MPAVINYICNMVTVTKSAKVFTDVLGRKPASHLHSLLIAVRTSGLTVLFYIDKWSTSKRLEYMHDT